MSKIDAMRPIFLYTLGLLMLIFSSVACKNEKSKAAITQVDLDGTDWEFYMIEQSGKKETTPPGLKINLAFLEGKLTGNASCNSYSAPYTLDDGKLTVGDVVATEKKCDNENWDARFVSAVKQASECEVAGELLTINCKNGIKLHFEKKTIASIAEVQSGETAEMDELLRLFPNLAPNQMHLFSILKGTNIDAYPFIGETVEFSMYNLFDPTSASVFQQAYRLGAYAIGKIGDLYILRVPGNKGSNSITLYRLREGKMMVEMPLALANDEPSVNIQQDAWLKDLNNDGKIEVIVRQISAPQGGIAQDVLRVFVQAADGSFQPSLGTKLKPEDYPLANLQ